MRNLYIFWQCYTDVLFCASVADVKPHFLGKIDIGFSIHIIVIVLAIILVVQGKPTTVTFEETIRTIAVGICNCARKYGPGPRIQATKRKFKQLYR